MNTCRTSSCPSQMQRRAALVCVAAIRSTRARRRESELRNGHLVEFEPNQEGRRYRPSTDMASHRLRRFVSDTVQFANDDDLVATYPAAITDVHL